MKRPRLSAASAASLFPLDMAVEILFTLLFSLHAASGSRLSVPPIYLDSAKVQVQNVSLPVQATISAFVPPSLKPRQACGTSSTGGPICQSPSQSCASQGMFQCQSFNACCRKLVEFLRCSFNQFLFLAQEYECQSVDGSLQCLSPEGSSLSSSNSIIISTSIPIIAPSFTSSSTTPPTSTSTRQTNVTSAPTRPTPETPNTVASPTFIIAAKKPSATPSSIHFSQLSTLVDCQPCGSSECTFSQGVSPKHQA